MFKRSILIVSLFSFVSTAAPQKKPFTQTWYGSFLMQSLTQRLINTVIQRATGHTPLSYFYSRLIHTQPRFIFENKIIKKGLETINKQLIELEKKIQPHAQQTKSSIFEVRLGKQHAKLKKEIIEIKKIIESQQQKLEKELYNFFRSKRWLMLKMNAFQLTQHFATTLAMNFVLQIGARKSTPFAQHIRKALVAQAFPTIMSTLSTILGSSYKSPVTFLSAHSNYVNTLFKLYDTNKQRALDSLKIILAHAYGGKPPSVPFYSNQFTTMKYVYIIDENKKQIFQYRFDIKPTKTPRSP